MKIEYFSLFPEPKQKKEKFPGMTDFHVKRGDIWELGNGHLLTCCSSCEKDNVSFVMDGKHSPLLFTSPPYSDLRTYNGCDISIDYIRQFISCFADYVDLICVNLGFKMKNKSILPYWNQYVDYALDNGLKWLAMNVWNKVDVGSISNQTHYVFPLCHEFIFVFGRNFVEINRTVPKQDRSINLGRKKTSHRERDGSVRYSPRGATDFPYKKMSSVQTVYPNKGDITRNYHPATFPIELPVQYIESCSHENDFIVEPFCGSGTTIYACEQTNRKCIAFEISEEYCNVILNLYKHKTGKAVRKLAELPTELIA